MLLDLHRSLVCLCGLLALLAHPALGQQTDANRFNVFEYEVAGNTLLPDLDIERALTPYLGEKKTIDDVEGARGALVEAYRRAGYPFVEVSIPEQDVGGAVVRLDVTEARIARTRVTGARYYSQDRILAAAPALAEGEALYLPEAQEQIAALNRQTNRRVTPVLRPGPLPGTTEVDLKVDDESPLSARVELNNYYSPNTTSLRALGSVRYENLFQRGHSASLLYLTSPEEPRESRVFSFGYTVPDITGRWTLSAFGIVSRSDVGTGVAGTSVLGDGRIFGLRMTVPLGGTERYSHALTLGGDYKDIDQNIIQPGLPALPTPLSYLPLTASYSASMATERSITSLTGGVTLGIRNLVGSDDEFDVARFNATSNFAVAKYEVAHTRSVFGKASWRTRFDGQLASGPLVSNEQFAAGGARSVRGYLEATAIGDNAARLSTELVSPSYAKAVSSWLSDLRFLAFAEGAELRLRDPLPRQTSSFTLMSVGLGMRANATRTVRVVLDYGYTLRDAPFTQAGTHRLQFLTALDF